MSILRTFRSTASELAKLGYDRSLLDEIVDTNNKQHYEYSLDGRTIRARQGHSHRHFCSNPATAFIAVARELSSNVPIVVCGSHIGNN